MLYQYSWTNASEGFIEFKKEEIEQSIPERFEQIVSRYPDNTAIKTKSNSLTYDELNRAANRVAHAILSQRSQGEEPVAFLLEHGTMSIITILGILKTGKIYLALDPAHPLSRHRTIIEDSQAVLIITNNKNIALAREISGQIPIINIDEIGSTFPDKNLSLSISPDTTAVIFYTSGSTGQPKGVVHSHRSILHYIMTVTNGYRLCTKDRQPHFFSCGFAWSLSPILGTLLNGAMLYPEDLKDLGVPNLAEWLFREEITIIQMIPSLFRQLVATFGERDFQRFPKLRILVLAGEPATSHDIELWKKHFSDKSIVVTALASTEAYIITWYFIDMNTEIAEGMLPVGYAAIDKKVRLFDDKGNEIGFNCTGEIAVESRYLSNGYWRKPELTQSVFLKTQDVSNRLYFTGDLGRMRPDGCLELIGRKDFQVKIRGHTVQPAEIEMALLDIKGIKQAAVIVRKNRIRSHEIEDHTLSDSGDVSKAQRLVAYITMDRKLTTSELRNLLSKKIPDYMIPSDFIILDSLPLTSTGKIDRKALPEPGTKRPELSVDYIAPRDELEARISKICEEILNVHSIGVKDNLNDLGVDSILYFNLILEIEKKLGRGLPHDRLAMSNTVEELANVFRTEEMPHLKTQATTMPKGHKLPRPAHIPSVYQKSGSKIWKSIRSLLFKTAVVMIPYPAGAGFISWYCGQKWIQRMFFQKEIRLIRQLLACIKSPEKEADIIQASLMENVFRNWILGALARSSQAQFDRWVTVTGLSTLQQSYQKGRGIILVVSHNSLGFTSLLALHRMGYKLDNMLILANNPNLLNPLGISNPEKIVLEAKYHEGFFIRQLSTAKEILEHGGIVLIAGDGPRGSSGIDIPFHGRIQSFKAGFAWLANSTKADAIPVFASIDTTGHIKVAFLDPLNKDMPEMSSGEKIEFLIRKYVALLEKRWAEYPGSIMLSTLGRFLSLPKA